jgi:hypothetical protein
LVEERNQIEQKLNDYQDLDQEQLNTDIVTNSNYFSYILLFGFAFLCIILVFMVSSGSNTSSNSGSYDNYSSQFGGKLGKKVYGGLFAVLILIVVIYVYKK